MPTPRAYTGTSRSDYRDLALEDAAADYLEVQARVADLEGERDVYRELLQIALRQAHERDLRGRRLQRLLRTALDGLHRAGRHVGVAA